MAEDGNSNPPSQDSTNATESDQSTQPQVVSPDPPQTEAPLDSTSPDSLSAPETLDSGSSSISVAAAPDPEATGAPERPPSPAEEKDPSDFPADSEVQPDEPANPAITDESAPRASESIDKAAPGDGVEGDENQEDEPEAADKSAAKSHKSDDPHHAPEAAQKATKAEVKPKRKQESGPLSNDSYELANQAFTSVLSGKFDRVPVVWGKDALAVTVENLQSRMKEKQQQAEHRKQAAEHHKEAAAAVDDEGEKAIIPERENKYKAVTKMYMDTPAISDDEIYNMIWGTHEERLIDTYFAWAQARQSSELSHVIERITKIEGVTAFMIFDIFATDDVGTGDDADDYEEDEEGYPVPRANKPKGYDGLPANIIYCSTDVQTARKILPFTKQLIWRLVETTRDLDPKNDVRYLRLVSDKNEIVVMPMFPRHFLITIQEPSKEPNKLFEKLGIVITHAKTTDDDQNANAAKLAILHRANRVTDDSHT